VTANRQRVAASATWFERAKAVLPGGVSSPVRAFGAVGGTPRFVQSAQGAWITDLDGNRYLDFVQSWGPLILGHAHPQVVEAVARAAANGLSYGAPHAAEVELAEAVRERCPAAERLRFVSSGTEAVMSAVRLARGATGRSLVVKFEGCYHGHSDGLLVAAGSGLITFGEPSSAGVPREVTQHTAVLPLDDEAAFEALVAARGDELAAVVIEPCPANNGLLLQRPEFLAFLRRRTSELGALLVFDEVISGFRVARGGAAELYDLRPDLMTFGKVLGGGMPVGAFGGRAELFEHLAPLGPVYQAGTLSGNPVAMAAGLTTLRLIDDENVLLRLENLGAQFQARLEAGIADHGLPVTVVRQASIFWLSLGTAPGTGAPRTAATIPPGAAPRYAKLFGHALAAGIYLAPSAYEVGFLSNAHTEQDLEVAANHVVQALGVAFADDTR
jgi:glutamate-1-semialdehyde 2,1-aminomutase